MLATCVQHPEATAGWKCDACEAALCPACTAWKEAGEATVELCTRCGGEARKILATRAELRASAAQAPRAIRATLSGLRALGKRVLGGKPGGKSQDAELVPVLGDEAPLIHLGSGVDADGPGLVGFDSNGNPILTGAGPEKPRSYEPIEIDLDESPHPNLAGSLMPGMEPVAYAPPGELELDLESGEIAPSASARAAPPSHAAPPPVAEVPEEPNAALAHLLAAGDLDACLALLAGSGAKVLPQTLPPPAWLQLGTKGLEAKNAKAASFGFKRCIDAAPEGPLAARAWLLAARTYDELLGDRKTSNRLLVELAKRFPGSQEGQFAARRLAGQAGG